MIFYIIELVLFINFFFNEARKEGRIDSGTVRKTVPQDIIDLMVTEIRSRNKGV